MEKLYTFGPEEAGRIANEAIRTIEKGSFATKYVDFSKAIPIMLDFRKRAGLGTKVEIVLKKEVKLRKQQSYQKSIRTMVCPFTNIIYGIYKGVNPVTQAPQWSTIELNEYVSFNLLDELDASRWMILRLSPFIENSVTVHRYAETPYWEFNDVRASNVNVISKAAEIVKITQILDNMPGAEMANLVRLFDFVVSPGEESQFSITDIQGYLLNIALNDPGLFMSKYKDGNRKILEMLHAGEAVGLIHFNFGSGYSAMGNPIGMTKEEAISYLRKDRNLYALIKDQVISQDLFARQMESQKPEKDLSQKQMLEGSLINQEENIDLI